MTEFTRGLPLFRESGVTVGVYYSGGVGVLLVVTTMIVMVVGIWKAFAKAGKPGWGAIVPIYNVILLVEIAGRPIWWIFLLLIPGINLFFLIIVSIDVANKFGEGRGFGLGLAFLPWIFYPILGFGDAEYQPHS